MNQSIEGVDVGTRRCRVCGSRDVRLVLDLGVVPLANSFVDPANRDLDEPKYPLGIQFCANCAIVQLPELVDPDVLFRHYLYTPSASATWREHCKELASWLRDRMTNAAPFVVEPASNDGCLLKEIMAWAPHVLGVEPALNIAAAAARDGIPTISEFFGEQTAIRIRAKEGEAAAVVGTNVLAHVPDILDFLRGAAVLIGENGIVVIEAPYLRDLVEKVAYDTVYHEHVSYLSVTALARAYNLAGLTLTHVERTPTHGGSIRFVGRAAGASPDATVNAFLAEEEQLGYASGQALIDFSTRVDGLRSDLRAVISAELAAGRRLAAYGATAKGNTLLSTVGVGADELQYVVDRNPLKQGLLTPGTHIPVVAPEVLTSDPIDTLLILAWNIADEVVAQQQWFAERGGRFLVPIPTPTFVGPNTAAVSPKALQSSTSP